MRIFCDYCQKPFEIKEDELDDWITLDPSDGSKVVMCGQCESRPTPRALDWLTRPQNLCRVHNIQYSGLACPACIASQ